jgi:hypothetical protein
LMVLALIPNQSVKSWPACRFAICIHSFLICFFCSWILSCYLLILSNFERKVRPVRKASYWRCSIYGIFIIVGIYILRVIAYQWGMEERGSYSVRLWWGWLYVVVIINTFKMECGEWLSLMIDGIDMFKIYRIESSFAFTYHSIYILG